MRKLLSWTGILTGLGCGLLAVTLLAGLPVPAAAQALGGSLVGSVVDESGAALPGTTVTINGAKFPVRDQLRGVSFQAADRGIALVSAGERDAGARPRRR